MQTLIDLSESLLPLSVNEVSWDEDTLSIAGSDWSFSTKGAWRIVDEESILAACWDKDVSDFVDKVGKLAIVAIETQGQTLNIDPVFRLSDNTWLEVFSTESVDPWVLELPNGKVFVGNS